MPKSLPHSVLSYFDHTVSTHPDAPALAVGSHVLSYTELSAKCGQLAGALKERGISSGSNVGLCLERSADLVASVLGILRTGRSEEHTSELQSRENLVCRLL